MPSTLVAAAIGVGAHCATDAVGPHLALIEAVCGSDRAQPMRTHRTLWDLCIMLYLHMHGSHESLLAGPTVRLRRTLAVGRRQWPSPMCDHRRCDRRRGTPRCGTRRVPSQPWPGKGMGCSTLTQFQNLRASERRFSDGQL